MHTSYIRASITIAVSIVVAACSLSGVSNDCAVGDHPLGTGTGGVAFDAGTGGSGGTGGGAVCACVLPINFNPECRDMVLGPNGCVDTPKANFTACRGGVGVCFGGICNAPDWPAACEQSPALPPWVPCDDAGDCDDGNPCTSDSCPNPGCESCLHVPVADLTDCSGASGGSMVCRQGACCDKPN